MKPSYKYKPKKIFTHDEKMSLIKDVRGKLITLTSALIDNRENWDLANKAVAFIEDVYINCVDEVYNNGERQ